MPDNDSTKRPKDRARRFCSLPGELTVTLPDGRVVARSGEGSPEDRNRPGERVDQPSGRKSAPFLSIGLIGWPAGPKSDDRSPVDS